MNWVLYVHIKLYFCYTAVYLYKVDFVSASAEAIMFVWVLFNRK